MTQIDLIASGLTVVFVTYMILTDKMVGTSYSISDSWNQWKKKNYSAVFVIFVAAIALGLFLVVETYTPKHEVAFNLLFIGGGFCCFCIGVAANFKDGWRESMYHNVFSALTFAAILLGLYVEGVKFPLESFVLLSAVILPISLPKKTTIIEICGISLSILGVYYL